MLNVLMLLLAARKKLDLSEVKLNVLMTSDKPPSVTPHSASPPGNQRTGSGEGPGGPERFIRFFANPPLPNLHSAYSGDSAPLEGLSAEAVLVFCSCLPAASAKLPLASVQLVVGGLLERH